MYVCCPVSYGAAAAQRCRYTALATPEADHIADDSFPIVSGPQSEDAESLQGFSGTPCCTTLGAQERRRDMARDGYDVGLFGA